MHPIQLAPRKELRSTRNAKAKAELSMKNKTHMPIHETDHVPRITCPHPIGPVRHLCITPGSAGWQPAVSPTGSRQRHDGKSRLNFEVSAFLLIRPSAVQKDFFSNDRDFGQRISHTLPMSELNNATIRSLKSRAQLLKPTLKVGKDGLSPQFIAEVEQTLKHRELIKVKFEQFKEQKDELAKQLAERTGSHLITRVGHVAVLFRPQPRGAQTEAGDSKEILD
jgi:RNA-binding protein